MSSLSRDMLKITLSIVTQWGWIQLISLHQMASGPFAGTCSVVTVLQPLVLTTALGHDVLMPCQLNRSEKKVTPSVLYWMYLVEDIERTKVWKPVENYINRVDLLDDDALSLNKSILLKNVQWADSGKYLCKLSVTTEGDERFRAKGNGSLLMIYDTLIFKLTGHNNSMLRCEVNVSSERGFVLSISYDGHKSQTVDSSVEDNGTAVPYVTLSETISLSSEGKYECQLHLNKDLITKNIFHYHLPVAGEAGVAEKNVSFSEPDAEVFPEPWLLYLALLLVPVTVLLGLLTALLMCRS